MVIKHIFKLFRQRIIDPDRTVVRVLKTIGIISIRERMINPNKSALDRYLENSGFMSNLEGNSNQLPQQVELLYRLVKSNKVTSVLEIGFNAGHGSNLILSTKKSVHVTSFDIGEHLYISTAKRFIDETYRGRHTLIYGDSCLTVPQYSKTYQDRKFDLIFIDGGHDYQTALNDLVNCKALSHTNTIVVLDDTVSRSDWVMHWNEGPNRAWTYLLERGEIVGLGTKDCSRGRGFSWGRYN